jgi:hypothetical protein
MFLSQRVGFGIILSILILAECTQIRAAGFVAPSSGNLYIQCVGGSAGATSQFGTGTSPSNFTSYLNGLPSSCPTSEVSIGPVSAGQAVQFGMQTLWNGQTYWAFSSGSDTGSKVAFTDVCNNLGMGGNAIQQTGQNTWVMHLNDAAHYTISQCEANNILIQLRLVSAGSTQPNVQSCGNSDLTGTYFYLISGGVVYGGAQVAAAEFGKFTADGQGNISGQYTDSIGGSLSQGSFSGGYTVQGDCSGTMTLTDSSQITNTVAFEIVENGASMQVAFSSSNGVAVGGAYRAPSQCGNSSLNGGHGYLVWGVTYSGGGSNVYTAAGRFVADGSGALTVKTNTNTIGGPNQVAGAGSYSISNDCSGVAQVTNASGTANYSIAVVNGGNVLFLQTDNGYTVSGTAQPQSPSLVLPQFAFGQGWYSALYFTNSTASSVSFAVNFTADGGTPLTVPTLGGTSTQMNIPPNGTAVFQAPNLGAFSEGYVSMTLPNGVSGYGIFRQSVSGRADQEAVVPLSSATSTTSTLAWDETGGAVTAVAIVNTSSVATNVAITVWDTNGNVIGTSSVALQPNAKTAATLHSLSGLGGMVGKQGSAKFTVSTGNVAVLGLRFSGVAFTSIPTMQQ